MASVPINLFVEQGTDYSATFTITNEENGLPLNLASYTAEAKIKKSYTSAVYSGVFTVEFVDRIGGVIKISLTSEQTSLLTGYRYVYDVLVTSPNGIKTRVIDGIIEISPGVT